MCGATHASSGVPEEDSATNTTARAGATPARPWPAIFEAVKLSRRAAQTPYVAEHSSWDKPPQRATPITVAGANTESRGASAQTANNAKRTKMTPRQYVVGTMRLRTDIRRDNFGAQAATTKAAAWYANEKADSW